MKKLFTLLVAITVSTSIVLAYPPLLIDGWDYELDWENYTARFFGCRAGVGCSSEVTSIVVPSHIVYKENEMDEGTIFTVTSIGYNACSNFTNLTTVGLPSCIEIIEDGAFDNCNSLKSINIPSSVRSIGNSAFSNCTSLSSINLPPSVKTIGRYAFSGCTSLHSFTIPYGIKIINDHTFWNCSNLTSIEFPITVDTIGWEAFGGCTSLSSINFGAVTTIWYGAFSGCTSLRSVTIPSTVTSIGNNDNCGISAFGGCSNLETVTINSASLVGTDYDHAYEWYYHIPTMFGPQVRKYIISDGIEYIGNSAFSQSDSLASVTFPETLTSIGNSAFSACNSLTSVEIPNSVTSIGEGAFYGCSSLASIDIPNSVTSIGNSAFSRCNSLTYATIGNSVTSIGNTTFGYCGALTSMTIPNSVTSIGDGAFYECLSLTSIEIPNSVTSIGKGAFSRCYNLTSATIGNSVTTIGDEAFYNCIRLTSIEIPNSVTSIGNYAFDDCSSLTTVTIPNSVTSIGNSAFAWCRGLTFLVFERENPAILGSGAFYETNDCPLIVPCSAVDAYKTAWPDYADRITCSGSGSQGITVRLDPQSCADWSVVRLWAWTSGGNLFDTWPGIVVSQDADGWYSYTFDESVESVNIIWTDGTNQTVNIEGVTASTCYALNSTSGKTITASVVDCGSTASNYYTIRFLNWDGTVLQDSQVKEGELPSYTGTTPVRPADEQYTYSFSSWSPAIATATADADYTAQFTATEKTTDPSIPTVQDLATAGYDVANKVVLCLYFDDAPCYDVVIAGTYMADEAGSWITDPEQLVHMAALESFEGWYAAEIPYSNNVQGKPIQLKSNGAFSWEYQSGDADAWIKRGGEGSQTAAIVAGYNNEADVYYPAPGCYIYELAYWKNQNNPCVIIPTHNYTIHLYAPDACEEMKPAIIGNFNNWNTGVPMSETTDEQGKKMYTITIADEEGKAFKFRDAAYDNWSNELQEYLEEYKLWATFSNFVLPAVTADTTIVFDFSDNSRYRFRLCEKTEDVVVWLKVPTGAPGYYNGAIEMVVYSADEPTAMPLQYNQEDELWSVELQAKGSNYFFVREANSEGNYILNYTHYYYSDGSDEYVWSTWGTTFQYYWEDGTGDFTGSKIIMLDISNPSYYKWDVPAIGTGIENVQSDDVQCTKVVRNGHIFIIRGDKVYTVTGQEVK